MTGFKRTLVALVALGMNSMAFAGASIHALSPSIAELNIHVAEVALVGLVGLMLKRVLSAYHQEAA